MKAIVGGIIMTLLSGFFVGLWFFTYEDRSTDSAYRSASYQMLWFALFGLVIGVSMIIVGIVE